MFTLYLVILLILLEALPGTLLPLFYWPIALALTLNLAFKKVSASDWQRAHPTELVQLLFIGIPLYGSISIGLTFALSFIDETFFSAQEVSWPVVIGLTVLQGLMIIRYILKFEFVKERIAYGKKTKRLDKQLKLEILNQGKDPFYFLTSLTGVPKEKILSTSRAYNYVEIPKKTGGFRTLSIPNDDLKDIQSKIATFFDNSFENDIHHCCHAYRKKRSIFTNSVPHLGCEVLVKLDIKNYFGSVTREQVKKAIYLGNRSIDYNPNSSEINQYLKQSKITIPDYLDDDSVSDNFIDILVNDQGLPQGAPTSPILANLLLKDFDQEVFLVAKSMNAKYTRYSDDLTISFKEDDSQKIAQIIKFIDRKIRDYGYRVNKKKEKIQVLRKHQAQRICGVTINSGKPTISRKQRKLVRAAQHNMSMGKKISFTENQLQGHIAYQKHIQTRGGRLSSLKNKD